MDKEPQEDSDLITVRNKTEANGNVIYEEPNGPPDGGWRAYAVVIGSFLTNGLIFGVINSYGVIYPTLEQRLKADGLTNTESRAALVGALSMGTTFFLSPLSGVLTGLMGLRLTAVLGGTIATLSLLISSFVLDNVNALYFTYGVMYGLGASFAYTPSLAILGHYFKKRLGLVNGIVTIGSSVFTVIMPPLMNHMIKNYSLEWLFRLLALFAAGIALCGLIFKPIPLMVLKRPSRKDKGLKGLFKAISYVQIWKNMKYRLWALCMPVALFGYFVPYVHIIKFIEGTFVNVNLNLPLQCIAITSGAGRLIFGYLADKPGVDRILMQQISFYVIGILTIILPFVKSFPLIIAITLSMGLFDGAFIALNGPIAIELCGGAYAAQAIGCMLGLAATPLSVGPPIAGYIYSIHGSYTLPFVLAGISPLIGATLMFTIRLPRYRGTQETNTNGLVISPMSSDAEKSHAPLLQNGQAKQQTLL